MAGFWERLLYSPDYQKYQQGQQQQTAMREIARARAASAPPGLRGLLESDDLGKVQAGIGLLNEQRLADIVGTPGTPEQPPQQRDIPYRDIPGTPAVPGTGFQGAMQRGDPNALPQLYTQLAGLGGDYTKIGLTGLNSLNPNSAESPSAVREYEFFKKLGPAEQRNFLEIKRAFQPYSSMDFQGGKAAFDKRVGTVSPLSTAAQEAAGQATVEGSKKSATVTAEGQATATLDLPKVETTAEQAIKYVDEMRKHPGRKMATGMSSIVPKIPGTNQANFLARLEQLKGGQFLQAYQVLRGGGQISEIEGKKATDAIARMDTSQTEGEFLKALDDYEEVIKAGLDNARKRSGQTNKTASQGKPQGNPQGWSIRKK